MRLVALDGALEAGSAVVGEGPDAEQELLYRMRYKIKSSKKSSKWIRI